MRQLQLYTAFHLNLAYSSIEEEQRSEVIEKCYWPLLRLASKLKLPLGIEASGYTLETAADIDPSWVAELHRLTTEGPCEFIGSGYAQIIGPLVPEAVNRANLRIGNRIYAELLGLRPTLALINEQAYSAGLIEHYLKAGYKAIIMEWDNPARFHPEWDEEWRYLPQHACDHHSNKIALIWNSSIPFQKFQRYAHGEIEPDEYLDYLVSHLSDRKRSFPVYSNDAEIFNFRPGRYHTEIQVAEQSEWERIEAIFKLLKSDERFKIIPPNKVLEMQRLPGAGNDLSLESPEHPIPVKKQGKYNITRWAGTGRDDLGINTVCRRISDFLTKSRQTTEDDWKELCYLWSSDFRTHITENRWAAYCDRLANFENHVTVGKSGLLDLKHSSNISRKRSNKLPADVTIERKGRYLIVETDALCMSLNCKRGLAIDALFFKGVADEPLIGTLPHGYYNDISLGADFYSGHLILETPGQPKVTDLNPVEPTVTASDEGAFVTISGEIPAMMGTVRKGFHIFREKPQIELVYELDCSGVPAGSMRLGHITLMPTAFKRDSLFYRTNNGGTRPETFLLHSHQVDHGAPVSFLVSASCSVGMTQGILEIGDDRRYLRLTVDKCLAALVGMVTYREVGESYFCRVALSAAEMDETSPQQSPRRIPCPQKFYMSLSASLTEHSHDKR